MKLFEAFLKSKILLLILLILPAIMIVSAGLMGGFDANPVEFLQLETGEKTLWLLLIVLWISPLKAVFPQLNLLKILIRHRRWIGVACFVYGVFHFAIYLLDSGSLEIMLENFTRYFIISGSLAFLILFALALTSSNGMIKKLGGKKWKNLHRLIYIATFLVFLHMIAKEKSNIITTFLYFVPLVLAEAYRIYVFWRVRHRKLSTS
ncbi:MAG: ferric reductase-like transmembrane domain-containing protein [SAR324 cluster bacterium]|nr:ferric reductase-like transmembrane domain-containing protein [SAR324 cluster bacterium]